LATATAVAAAAVVAVEAAVVAVVAAVAAAVLGRGSNEGIAVGRDMGTSAMATLDCLEA